MRERMFLLPVGAMGGWLAAIFGGWDFALQTMILFMVLDYISGLIVAGVFKKSQKSECGAISSRAGLKGIATKCMMLIFVIMGHHLDHLMGLEMARQTVIFAFIANETVSIIENAGLMGVPIPAPLEKAIDILKMKGDNGK
ncbi:MAG: phage holin family protein [Defluviitaleaceae bacterium]|nr:phage holin family protein [Defluviitaleaceae bacterium]MCL2264206.1 phage holin family protein [Defluviitaleaceae bacterium]